MKLFSGRKQKKVNIDFQEYEEYSPLEIIKEPQFTQTKEQKLQYVENCCDQMVICQKRIETAKNEYNQVNHYLSDISTIENLGGKAKEDLLFQVRRIKSLKEDKKSYADSGAKMSEKKYEYINNHESEMPKILKEMQSNEQEFQVLKNDLHNIEGEKAALKYERKVCVQRLNMLRKMLKVVLFVSAAVLLILTMGQVNGKYDFTIGFYITIVLAIGAIAAILTYNQNQERNLKISELKLNKAIGLLNRYKLRYVNMKSGLDYFYQVYGVTNSYELSNLWRLYLTAKKEREAYFKMSDNLYKSTEEYMDIIKGLNLYDPSVWSYQMNAILEKEEMEVIRKTLHNRRDGLKKNIDYNTDVVNNSKNRIKKVIEDDPSLADEVLALVDRKEKEIT